MKNFTVLVILFMLFSLISSAETHSNEKIKVGLALGYGGLNDMSFNDMQYNGLIEASKKFNIDIVYKVPKDETEESLTKIIEELVKEKCDLILSSGYLMTTPINNMSKKYPEKMFVIMDQTAEKRENLISVIYSQHEGSFVVGALAAKMTKTNKIGFLGGVNIDVLKAFETGYIEGAKYVNPKINVVVEYCTKLPDFKGFSSPKLGFTIADKMYKENIDIIYAAAGGTGTGIIEAANANKKYVIGVDSDQDYLAKGRVLTSMMKRLDLTVIDIVDKYINKKLVGGIVMEYGYNNNGVSITQMKYTKDLIGPKIIGDIRKIEAQIKTGEIKVTNTLKK